MTQEKVLILASVASMIDQFNMSNIDILLSLGYEVHVACNFEKGSTCTAERINQLKKKLDKLNVKYYQIDFTRSVFNIFKDIEAYKQVKKIMVENRYKFIHCHSPIGGVVGRLACKKTRTKCIYTAHGFHFFKGAPIQNWLIFYPIEKWLSKYTDILITINKEDYDRAKKKFNMKKIEYVPGVGIDIDYIKSIVIDKNNLKNALNIPIDNKVIISVGELSKRKNHEIVIKSLKNIQNVTYIICGQGDLKDHLNYLAKQYNVDLRLLGFRSDRIELMKMSDIFIFPSLQEGLPVALMEAIACELPCIASKIRGNIDLIVDEKNGYLINTKDTMLINHLISKILNCDTNLYSTDWKKINFIQKFDFKHVDRIVLSIYKYFD